MSIELPAINAIVARLANPEISLAAYGVWSFRLRSSLSASDYAPGCCYGTEPGLGLVSELQRLPLDGRGPDGTAHSHRGHPLI